MLLEPGAHRNISDGVTSELTIPILAVESLPDPKESEDSAASGIAPI